jgi:RNA polymerase sigma-70 factor (ECF subfamily)
MHDSTKSVGSLLAMAVRFEPELIRRARQLAGSDAEARDLVQDTFERAMRAARTPGNLHEFRPWMLRMLTNLWIDRVRVTKRRRNVPLTDSLFVQPDIGRESSLRPWRCTTLDDVKTALEQVPEPHRSAYRKHTMEGRSYHELARELGVPTATVGTRILRARRCLRQILEGKLTQATDARPATARTGDFAA